MNFKFQMEYRYRYLLSIWHLVGLVSAGAGLLSQCFMYASGVTVFDDTASIAPMPD